MSLIPPPVIPVPPGFQYNQRESQLQTNAFVLLPQSLACYFAFL